MPGAGVAGSGVQLRDQLLDRACPADGLVEPGAEQLQEDPLGPLVVARVDRGEAAAVVVVDAQAAQLGLDGQDVGLGGDPRVLPRLDGVLLGGQAEGVVAHRVQHVVAVHPAEPAGHVRAQVAQRVADVQPGTRGVREHVHQEVLGPVRHPLEASAQPAGRVGRVEGALGLPAVLPGELDPLRQRRRVAVRGHAFVLLGGAGLVGRLAHRSCSWIRVPAADIKKPLTQEGSPCCLNWSGQHGRESRSRPVTRSAYSRGARRGSRREGDELRTDHLGSALRVRPGPVTYRAGAPPPRRPGPGGRGRRGRAPAGRPARRRPRRTGPGLSTTSAGVPADAVAARSSSDLAADRRGPAGELGLVLAARTAPGGRADTSDAGSRPASPQASRTRPNCRGVVVGRAERHVELVGVAGGQPRRAPLARTRRR